MQTFVRRGMTQADFRRAYPFINVNQPSNSRAYESVKQQAARAEAERVAAKKAKRKAQPKRRTK